MPRWMPAVLFVASFAALIPVPTAAQDMPEGVTQQMIDDGGKLFRTEGVCYACHGQQGEGMQGLGADLTDDEWLHNDGSFDGILQTITNGVSGDESSVGVSMPPKGGSSLNEEQVRAVAAYVWSLRKSSE